MTTSKHGRKEAHLHRGNNPHSITRSVLHDFASNFKAASYWHGLGYNVVPRAGLDNKHPAVKWKHLQNRHVSLSELQNWAALFANGLGLITGAISGIIVIDTDGPEGEAVLESFERQHGPLPRTRTVRSGSGRGKHRHYQHPGHCVKTRSFKEIKIDIKGDKGFSMLPPSLHKSGGRYQLIDTAEPAPLPNGLLEFIRGAALRAKPSDDSAGRARRHRSTVLTSFGPVPDHLSTAVGIANISPVKERVTPSPRLMRQVLAHLHNRTCFSDRDGIKHGCDGRIVKVGWRECGMALKLAYGDAGFDLWSVTHEDNRARQDAPAQWASFAGLAGPGHVTIATILKAAADAGIRVNASKQFSRRRRTSWK